MFAFRFELLATRIHNQMQLAEIEAGLLLILGIDQFLDMGRSATNVIGNSLAASAVAKFEGELGPARDDASAAAVAPRPAHA